jgi:hypothetical protein
MAKLIVYLLESSAVLAFFYLLYIVVLSRETFFTLNRFFLLGMLLVSLLFPLVSVDIVPAKIVDVERPIEEISKLRMSYYEAMALWEFDSRRTAKSAENINGEETSASNSDSRFCSSCTVSESLCACRKQRGLYDGFAK